MVYDYKLHLAIRTPRASPWEQSVGEVEEDLVQISAMIPAELKEKLDARKKVTGETTAELITHLLREME